jgi:hypothetical protein
MSSHTVSQTRTNPLVRMLSKIGLSLLLGVLAFALSQVLNAPEPELVVGIGVSVFVSGIAVVVQFLIEVERRLDSLTETQQTATTSYELHRTAQQQEIAAQFSKINSSTRLFAELDRAGLQPGVLAQLARNAIRLQGGDSFVTRFAQHEIYRLGSLLKGLADGTDVPYEGEDRDWLLGLPLAARRSIAATSLTTVDGGVDDGLWDSELGQRYLEAQREAILAHDICVRRIFIIDRPGSLDAQADLRTVVARHQDIGVQVRVLRLANRRGGSRFDYFTDFIVVDEELCYQAFPSSALPEGGSAPVIVSTTLVTDPVRVHRQLARFEVLWAEATDPDVTV